MKKTFHLVVTIPLFFFLSLLLLFLLLPIVANQFLIPPMLTSLPFSNKAIHLSRLSLHSLLIDAELSGQYGPAINVPGLEIHFNPRRLIKKELDRIVFNSASLHLAIKAGRISLRGADTTTGSPQQESTTMPLLLPLTAGEIVLKSNTITLHRENQPPLSITLDGSIFPVLQDHADGVKQLTGIRGKLKIGTGLNLSADVTLESDSNGQHLLIHIHSPDIAQFAALFNSRLPHGAHGELNIDGQIDVKDFSNITNYDLIARLSQYRLDVGSVVLADSSEAAPLELRIKGTPSDLHYQLDGLGITRPTGAQLSLAGAIEIASESFHGEGRIDLSSPATSVMIALKGTAAPPDSQINFTLKNSGFAANDTMNIGKTEVSGNMRIKAGQITASLDSRVAAISEKTSKTELTDLRLQLPLHFPFPPPTDLPPGKLTIGEIRYNTVKSGALEATLIQRAGGLDFATALTTPFLPDSRLTCNGSGTLPATLSLACSLAETPLSSANLPPLIQLPEPLSFTAKLAADSRFEVRNGSPSGVLSVHLTDGAVNYNELSLEGITFDLDFPHLPLIQSGPGQICTIDTLKMNTLHFGNARIHFRIEDTTSIFIERSRLAWCRGKVESGGLRLSTEMEEVETTLYCDRLNFTELLSQFGIEDTEGEGSLNGKLPMKISRRGVKFEDGFLFSTPGNSGIVRFGNTNQLRQGMPGIDQSSYLDYSMKALENFSYNWTRMSFNTEGDDLLIAMQLDGKPAEPLAFGYKDGRIVPTGKGAGLQHPIRLDVNFRLPLEDMFQYGQNIQSIMENM